MSNSSILDLFLHQVSQRGNETAALVKGSSAYEPVSWNTLWERAQKAASALVGMNIQPDDKVAILAHSRLEWSIADLAILASGAVTVPIYPSSIASECQFILEHSEAGVVFVENADQVAKLREVRAQLPNVRKLILIDGDPEAGDDWVISYQSLLGEVKIDEATLQARRASLSPQSILTIIYTSGTTGRPKGVVLTHDAMIHEANAVVKIDLIRQTDVQLIFLPYAHVFAKMLEVTWFAVGHVMAFAENMTTIKQNLAEVRPTLMCGVPRIFEKFHAAVVDKVAAGGGIKQKLFERALALSLENGECEEKHQSLSLVKSIQFALLRRIIFAKVGEGIMQTLGGRMRLMVSGGAPLSKTIGWFFRDAGIPVVEGYGLTESCAGTFVNRVGHNQIGTVGPALPEIQVRIAEDGEILLKGPMIMREYYKDEEATKAAIVDGWFQTGDIGELDPRTGALRITDRKKDLIVTAGGKNVAPQKIENLLKSQKLISQVVVHGDRRKFLSALITLDPDALKSTAATLGVQGDYAALCRNPAIEKAVAELVAQVNSTLPSFETIKKFKVLEEDFSIESGELTPKLSIKRKVVNARYGHILDAFYEEHGHAN